jgi:hypothetical protein
VSTLLEINNEYLAFRAALEAAAGVDGQIVPEAEAELNSWYASINENLNAKLDNMACYIEDLESRASARLAAAKRLQRRAEIDTTLATWLRKRLFDFLQAQQIRKVETERYTVGVVGNGGLPPTFVKYLTRLNG